ncbi:hypothetical protein TW86_04130 [Halomonas sp. S2151]|uniref:toprim domain-containing protein n=1 Tax=Halomonas sp. S2151 TaxID=579478 RepID=UPI0005FA13BA|nr:toprim domain-containing protein [Halomonas sp. S2151]KJZ17447.1 hypothetical protein TW86_04130 [Halomonas sp. S2151]
MANLKKLLEDLDMRDYLDTQGITYKTSRSRKGLQLIVKECPVCGSDKWKVYLNERTGLGNCFDGDHPPGENFNKWSFVKANIGATSGKQVAEHLEQYMEDLGFVIERDRREVSYEAITDLPEPSTPMPDREGRIATYLWERNVTARACEYFKLRFCSEGRFRFKQDGREGYQDFSMRVIIPVFDITGDYRTFQGRDITGTADDKYRFAMGMPASGAYLYNGHNALGKAHVIVSEGAFDVWSIQQFLWDQGMTDVEAIGTFGKHLSQTSDNEEDQLSAFLMLRDAGLKSVTFMWDAEPAAIRDALAACDLLESHGIKCRFAQLPPGLDPNEATPAEIGAAIASAKPYSKALRNRLRLKML